MAPAKKIVKKPAAKAFKKSAAKSVAKKKPVKPVKTAVKAKPKPVAKSAVKSAAKTKVAVAKLAKPVESKSVAHKPVPPSGIPEQLRDAALKILDERQADDIVTLDLAGRSSVADYMLIASGRAGRQVSAIADYIREAFMKLGVKRVRIEGMAEANWVLIDGGDVIVHLFRPEVRSYYDLDAIWNGKRPG